jgi:hypothetical protein
MIGGLISYYSNKSIKSQEWSRSIQKEDIQNRKHLYSEFLKESYNLCIRVAGNKRVENLGDFNSFTSTYSQIEFTSSKAVVAITCKLFTYVVQSHQPNKDFDEKEYVELKTEFITTVKNEINELQNT